MNQETKENIERHLKSFVLTYITTFFILYTALVTEESMFDLVIIGNVAKVALLSIVRNLVKLYTDKK